MVLPVEQNTTLTIIAEEEDEYTEKERCAKVATVEESEPVPPSRKIALPPPDE